MNEELFQLIDRFNQARILVVGDLMLDSYIWGKVSRISPEAPVPVVRVTSDSDHLGGSANVIANIRALGGYAVPVGLIGQDEAGNRLIRGLEALNAPTSGLVISDQHQTIRKTRIIAHQQQVVRVDREDLRDLDEATRTELRARLTEWVPQVAAVIVSDYGKGVITPDLLRHLFDIAGCTLISVDPKDKNFDHYHHAGVITPNQGEAERLAGMAIDNETDLREAARRIFERLSCKNLLITRGEHGMALFCSPEDMLIIPTRAREVYDVSGAGDTVIATFTLARAVGASPHQAAVLANAAAGVVVAKLGTATVTGQELREALERARPR